MKVYVYSSFENMRTNVYAIEINNVNYIGESKFGGVSIEDDSKGYAFPKDVFMIVDKEKEGDVK